MVIATLLTLWTNFAMAGELTCADMIRMVSSNTPEAALLDAVATQTIYLDEVSCMETMSIPKPVQAAARAKAIPRPGADRSMLLLEATLPEPEVASSLSVFIGFGAGHYYACNGSAGKAFLGTQAGGLAAVTLGTLWALQSPRADVARVLQGAGVLTFAGSRVVDIVMAPRSAHESAREIILNNRRTCLG